MHIFLYRSINAQGNVVYTVYLSDSAQLNKVSALSLTADTRLNAAEHPFGGVEWNLFSDFDEDYYNGGLHEINVVATNNLIVNNGSTDYKIVCSVNSGEFTPILQKYIKASTGAEIGTASAGSWNANNKQIVVGNESLFAQAGLTMPKIDLGWSGYYLKTVGNTIFIMADTETGLRNGIYNFLHYTIGFEAYSADCVVFNKSSSVYLYDFDIVEKGDFDLTLPCNYLDYESTHEMLMMSNANVFIPTTSDTGVDGFWHNSFHYLPPAAYYRKDNGANYHPKWYATVGDINPDGSFTMTNVNGDVHVDQLCYSAHGDAQEYALMLDTVFEKLKTFINAKEWYKYRTTITLTIEDNMGFCTCSACTAAKEKYGSDSGIIVKFMNDLSVKVNAYLKAEQPDRELNLLFFAYNGTVAPPIKDGKATIHCNDNVAVYFAPIEGIFIKPLNDASCSINAEIIDKLEKWSLCSDKLYLWLYNTNFKNYIYPYNSFESLISTYRTCIKYNTVFMYTEGQWEEGQSVTAFGTLKEFINAKTGWNVNYTAEELYSQFFNGYFGTASGTMRTYYNELIEYLKAHPATGAGAGTISENISTTAIWDKATLTKWLGYIDNAYAEINGNADYSSEEKAMYIKHIKLESIFLRYALITLYGDTYDSNTLKAMKTSLLDDAQEVGVIYVKESHHQNSKLTDVIVV